MENRRKVHHGRRSSYSNLGAYPTHVRDTIRNTYTRTPPGLAPPSHRVSSPSKWRFICISGEKSLRTIWAELGDEFPEIFNLCAAQTLENAARRCKAGTPRKTITEERIWNKRPVGLAIKMPTSETVGEFVILEFKRMSDVTDQYVTRARNVAVAQYASIKSALERTLGTQGWSMSQRSFIAGAISLNE